MTTTTTTMPPDRLSIDVTVAGDMTVSRFVIRDRGMVTFYNKGNRELTLLFRNEKGEEESPFCKGNNKPEENPVRIRTGGSRTLTICRGLHGRWFKYTAQIDGAGAEDPIFIVD